MSAWKKGDVVWTCGPRPAFVADRTVTPETWRHIVQAGGKVSVRVKPFARAYRCASMLEPGQCFATPRAAIEAWCSELEVEALVLEERARVMRLSAKRAREVKP